MQDMHNSVKAVSVIAPVAVGTTGVGQTGVPVDLANFGSCEFVIGYGAVTATAAEFTVEVLEGDTATGATSAVADADLIGTEADAGLAAGTRVDGSTEKVAKRIGYKGSKRFANVKISSTATAGVPVSCQAVLGHPRKAPVA